MSDSADRAAEQTSRFGHDSGYFRLGRDESSHEIGCRGELIAQSFLQSLLGPEASVHLADIGAATDLCVQHRGATAGFHVKTGLCRSLPPLDQPFGVHFGQRLEMTGAVRHLAGVQLAAVTT